MPNFSWDPVNNEYYPDQNGQYTFASGAAADAANAPGYDPTSTATQPVNNGASLTNQFFQNLNTFDTNPADKATEQQYQTDYQTALASTTASNSQAQQQKQADQQTNASNFGIIQQYLQQLGITDPSAISWAQGLITSGASPAQIEVEMYNQPFFKARFPGIFTRQAAGLSPISPADYVSYENSAQQLENAYGLPKGFLDDPTLIGNLIGQNVSMEQLQGEVEQGYAVVDQAPQSVRDAFSSMYGPSGDSALASYFIDGDRSLPLLEKQILAAQNMGAGTQQGFKPSQTQAETMAGMGTSYSQAQSGFSNLQQIKPYFTPGVGESQTEDINTTGINAQFGLDATSQAALARLESQRKSEFAGGGGAMETSQGVVGAGSQRPF